MVRNLGLPAVAVIIPTHNEEATIEHLLEALRESGAQEVVVVDGESTDRTAKIAARYARVLRAPRCRALQMNAGARASAAEVLLFLHADVRLSPHALKAIQRAMRDPSVAGGNLDIEYEGDDLTASCFTKINRWRRRWGVFYGDSGIFCRREVFESLGGFRPWPILEDYDLARRLWKRGSLAFLEEQIRVSSRRWRRGGVLATLWNWFWIQGLYLVGVSPHRLARWYQDIR